MTTKELRAKLSMIEPTESIYAGIEESDVPALEQLLSDSEEWIASRAVFALSRVASRDAIRVLAKAASDQRPQVRVSVAAAVGQRPIALPNEAVLGLLQDKDIGVRKFATLAVKPENGPEVRTLLNRISTEDAIPIVRENAAEAMRKMR
jgi:HEAT repeat protein